MAKKRKSAKRQSGRRAPTGKPLVKQRPDVAPQENVAAPSEPPFICRGCNVNFGDEYEFRVHVVESGHLTFYFRRRFGTKIAV